MKQVHNVRVRVHNRSREVVDAVLARADAMARRDEKDLFEVTITEDEGLVIGELWLDHQQPVRRFLAVFLNTMRESDRKAIHDNPTKYLDTATHCYFHCGREAFVDGRVELAAASGSVAVRFNIAAFPATREKATAVVQELFG